MKVPRRLRRSSSSTSTPSPPENHRQPIRARNDGVSEATLNKIRRRFNSMSPLLRNSSSKYRSRSHPARPQHLSDIVSQTRAARSEERDPNLYYRDWYSSAKKRRAYSPDSEKVVMCMIGDGIPQTKRPKQKRRYSPKSRSTSRLRPIWASKSAMYRLPHDRLQYPYDPLHEDIEVFYFDHGNAAYYCCAEHGPKLLKMSEKPPGSVFWKKVFSAFGFLLSFISTFLVQLIRFILLYLVRPLTTKVVSVLGDHFVKPFLSALFNAVLQPILIFLYNVATSLRDLVEPLAIGAGLCLREVARVLNACRFVTIEHHHYYGDSKRDHYV